ncbi:MAG: hypothetical protein KF718_16100 [Polyangiaceae bacterium]|nr:hypothetical protein [Polyangiaceae bacterium]
MHRFVRPAAKVALLGTLLAGSFYAGAAYAADPRLDQADANVEKAIVLLEAAENPGVNPPFGGHRKVAVASLKLARKQIAKAKQYADNPPKPKPKPKP